MRSFWILFFCLFFLSVTGCGSATAAVIYALLQSGETASEPAQTEGPSAPVVTVSPVEVVESAYVPVDYTLIDGDSAVADIIVKYSTDGLNYYDATEAVSDPDTGKTSDGVGGLAVSATGVAHTFVWDSLVDGVSGVTTVYIEITATDAEGNASTPASVSFSLANTPPQVDIVPLSGTYSGTIVVIYKLSDEASDKASITIEYSTDGANYSAATEAPDPNSEGTMGLSTSPDGITHLFFWDSLTDTGMTTESNVYIRITPQDSQGEGTTQITGPFTVDNKVAPSVDIFTPSGVCADNVTITYILYDANSSSIDITVQYSMDGGLTWKDATDAGSGAGSEGTTGLSSSPSGVSHTFVWASATDEPVGYSTQCRVRIQPYNGTYYGEWASTNDFTLSNNQPPVCSVQTPTTVQSGNVTINFSITDPEGDLCDIEVFYSPDDGLNFYYATLSSGSTTGIVSDGSSQSVVWDSATDIGGFFCDTIRFKIVPYDFPGRAGTAGVTLSFIVDNTSWSGAERVTVSNGNESRFPVVTISAAGEPIVVFQDNRNGSQGIWWAKKVSGNWQAYEFYADPTHTSTEPDAVCETTGYLSCVCVVDGIVLSYWRRRISDNSYSVADFTNLTDGSSNVCEPSIAIDPSDNIYVVWADDAPGDYEIRFSIRDSSTGNWAPTLPNAWYLSNSGTEAREPRATFANGLLHIVWMEDDGNDWEIYYNTYNPSSGVIGTPLQLTDNNRDDIHPDIAVGTDGKIYVTYRRWQGGDTDIFSRVFDGSSWGTEKRILNTPRYVGRPRIALVSTLLNVVWGESDGTRSQVWHSFDMGDGTFSSPFDVSQTSSGYAQLADIAVDSNYTRHIVYECTKNGAWEIFYHKR